jgi:hypothetical protein
VAGGGQGIVKPKTTKQYKNSTVRIIVLCPWCTKANGLTGGRPPYPKIMVLKNWRYGLTFVDYIDDWNLCSQNVVVMKKGT